MRYNLIILVFVINVSYAFGQDFLLPIIKSNGKQIVDFIPKDWNLVDTITGDLNKDNLKDIVLVIENKNEQYLNTDLFQHFILIIAFRDSLNDEFKLIEQCNNLITYNQSSSGPWYEDMDINNEIFSVSFFKGGSTDEVTHYKFRFQDNGFYLIGADRRIYNPSTQDFKDLSFNFLSKKLSISTGNDLLNTKSKTEWQKMNFDTLMTLKSYKGPYTWEVSEDIFL